MDEITAEILRVSCPVLRQRIISIFNYTIRFDIHPQVYNIASIVIKPGNGKRDPTNPRTCRPIALLSCLGKYLERLIARRLSYWALKQKMTAKDQCSAIRHRSTVDLTTALYYDIHYA